MFLVPALLVIAVAACGGDKESSTQTVSPPATIASATSTASTITTPAPTAPGQTTATATRTAASTTTYRNAALGFELEVPTALDDSRATACRPQASTDGAEVGLGSNVSIRVTTTNVRTASEAASAFLTNFGATAESTTNVPVSGVGGVRTEYRLASGRFGIATFVLRQGRLYTLVFEARDTAQCGGLVTPTLYDAIVAGFRFT